MTPTARILLASAAGHREAALVLERVIEHKGGDVVLEEVRACWLALARACEGAAWLGDNGHAPAPARLRTVPRNAGKT